MTTNIEVTEMPEKSKNGIPIIYISAGGALTKERYEHLETQLKNFIKEHGTIRVMLVLQEMEGMTAPAKEEDSHFEAKHFSEIDRVAVACATCKDGEVPESSVPFADVNTRFFPVGEMEQALKWLKLG